MWQSVIKQFSISRLMAWIIALPSAAALTLPTRQFSIVLFSAEQGELVLRGIQHCALGEYANHLSAILWGESRSGQRFGCLGGQIANCFGKRLINRFACEHLRGAFD